jgi:hypothetical protein
MFTCHLVSIIAVILMAVCPLRAADSRSQNETYLEWIKKMPFSSRLDPYLEFLGVKNGVKIDSQKNGAIDVFDINLLKSKPCFSTLTGYFYQEINYLDIIDRMASPLSKEDMPMRLIDESAASIGQRPGWLWQKALEVSKGNPNLAMRLIGMCGHDDGHHENVFFDTVLNPVLVRNLELEIRKNWSHLTVKYPGVNLEGILKGSKTFLGTNSCTSYSTMLIPKSLGQKYDIDENLKEEIKHSQNQGSLVPAKYYHVIGGAYASCELIKAGVPSIIAKRIHLSASGAYRSSTINDMISPDIQAAQNFNVSTEFSENDIVESIKRVLSFNTGKSLDCNALSKEHLDSTPQRDIFKTVFS